MFPAQDVVVEGDTDDEGFLLVGGKNQAEIAVESVVDGDAKIAESNAATGTIIFLY